MVTYSQYIKRARTPKKFRSSTPHLNGAPMRFGTCLRVGTVKPKKPNSAQRKISKVSLTNERKLTAYIPGCGHTLQKNSEVAIRGGRVPDLPGVHYHIIRGLKDLKSEKDLIRIHRRSKFGKKKDSQKITLSRRAALKAKKRELRKAAYNIKVSEDTLNELGFKDPDDYLRYLEEVTEHLLYNHYLKIKQRNDM